MKSMKLFRMLALAITIGQLLEDAKDWLELLAQDDYEAAAAHLLTHPALQDDLERLSPEVLGAAPLLLPLFLKALDRALPEEQLLAAIS